MAMKTNRYAGLDQATSMGIDVSKKTLDLCWLSDQGESGRSIRNQPSALRSLAEALVAADYRGKIIIESTGYYHWLAVVILSEAGLDVRLINPLLAHKHHRGGIRKVKSDPVDAATLAGMGLTERRLPPRWHKGTAWVAQRHRIGLISTLDRSLQQMKASLASHRDALALMGETDDPTVAAIQAQIEQFEKTKRQAEDELARSLATLSEINRQRYASIPGISDYLAGIMNLMLRPEARQAKSWIAFVGLDISVRESGQWRGRTRLTKRGMGYLRKKFFQAAWGAMQNDPQVRAYYDQLRAQGRPYVESMLIIARKLLRIAYHLQKNQEMYDPDKAWA